ncbi:hypothetical protein GCM10009093_16830 [Brevundimonas terrae]|uniref:DUF3617 family protein n=1 Tax=Brevundimonas terrae TaxID=363631 RepID=A0ABN0YCP2_9CAUL|nr:hypothetical protein [Brevundimonas terrae]NIJ26417.1 hypothetical protein [Brevundimonas terrae]
MKTVVSILTAGAALLAASVATAQPKEVAGNLDGGLPWAVAAQDGTAWRLECRFRPVAIRGVYQNRMTREGKGASTGNLPADNGSCTLTRLSGEGNIGVALVKDGTPTAAGSIGTTPAIINVF